jgi:6-phosphogluconolactonase (cycloisomerase 2 family)
MLLTSSAYGGATGPLGALTQLSGKAGCFTHDGASEDGAGTCGQARGMAETESAVVSPDGKNVYVGSYRNNGAGLGAGFAIFKRNTKTGTLKQLGGKAGCITGDGASNAGAGTCTVGRGIFDSMGDGRDLVFTSNGRWAYIATNAFGGDPGGLMIFKRNPKTGALTQLSGTAGCVTTDGSDQNGPGACKVDSHLLQASGLTFSSDEKFLYVTGTGDSSQIEVLRHNSKTGGLKQLQCISQAPVPAGCSAGRVVGDTQFIAIAPNGKHAYAGQYSYGMSVFNRNPKTGLLTQKSGTAGCLTEDGDDDTGATTCATARLTEGTFPLLIAPNGKTLYNADSNDGLSTFHINKNGTLSQLSGTQGCMSLDGKDNNNASTCAVGRAIGGPYGGAMSADGRTMYMANDNGQTVGGIAAFKLNAKTGVATQLPGNWGCVTDDGSAGGAAGTCANGRALGYGYGLSITPDGRFVYEATDSTTAGLAIFHRKTPKAIAVP